MEYEINVWGDDMVSSSECWWYAFLLQRAREWDPRKTPICWEGGPFGALIVCYG